MTPLIFEMLKLSFLIRFVHCTYCKFSLGISKLKNHLRLAPAVKVTIYLDFSPSAHPLAHHLHISLSTMRKSRFPSSPASLFSLAGQLPAVRGASDEQVVRRRGGRQKGRGRRRFRRAPGRLHWRRRIPLLEQVLETRRLPRDQPTPAARHRHSRSPGRPVGFVRTHDKKKLHPTRHLRTHAHLLPI